MKEILSFCIYVSNHHIVYFKYFIMFFIILQKNWKNKKYLEFSFGYLVDFTYNTWMKTLLCFFSQESVFLTSYRKREKKWKWQFSKSMFLISFWDLTSNYFNVHISTTSVFMMIEKFCKTILAFSVKLFTSFWALTSNAFSVDYFCQQSL